MNIHIEGQKSVAGGSDGAFIDMKANTHYARVNGVLKVGVTAVTATRDFAGAEQRPIRVRMPLPDAPLRAVWPAIAVAIAIGYMLGHGNWGGAAIAGVWLLGWSVQR